MVPLGQAGHLEPRTTKAVVDIDKVLTTNRLYTLHHHPLCLAYICRGTSPVENDIVSNHCVHSAVITAANLWLCEGPQIAAATADLSLKCIALSRWSWLLTGDKTAAAAISTGAGHQCECSLEGNLSKCGLPLLILPLK